jgi:hypothetical protein
LDKDSASWSWERYNVEVLVSKSGIVVALGGLVVAYLPLDPWFAGSNPAEDFLRRGSKAVGPMS